MKKIYLVGVLLLVLVVGTVVVTQFFTLRKAHSSFENYYAFRGCSALLKKTDSYGLCKLSSGKVIKLVSVNNKWYLDGDLPVCYFNTFCL